MREWGVKAWHNHLSKSHAQHERGKYKDARTDAHAELSQPPLRPTSGKQQFSDQHRDAYAPDNVIADLPLGQNEIDAEPSPAERGRVDEIRIEERLKRQSFF